jgi:hypothetical protein
VAGDRARSEAMTKVVRERGRRLLPVLAVAAALLSLNARPAGAQGIGISPVRLAFDDALRGGTYAESLILSNSNADGETEFRLSALGEIASWVRFMDEDTETEVSSFVVPASERVQVGVTVVVPGDVANRDYSGRIQVTAQDVVDGADQDADGAEVGLGGFVDVVVSVSGDERRAGRVIDAFVSNAEVGMDQRFEARVQNTGNVSMQAQLDVRILRNGQEVTSLSTAGQNFPVLPEKDDAVFVEWATEEQLGGEYTAEFVVLDVAGAKPLELGSAIVPFRLEPRGTFTRSGTFDDLGLRNDPSPDGVAQVEATFTNTGEIEASAQFVGELYRDGELVATIESLERTSRPGETVVIDVPVELADRGDYQLRGKVYFEGFVTPERDVGFAVGANRDASSRTATILAICGAVLLCLATFHGVRNLREWRRAKRAAAARLRAYDRHAATRRVREPVGR